MSGGPVLLALDATTEACSVALRAGGEEHGLWRRLPRGHSGALLPMLERLLAEAGCTRGAIDAIAFCAGPGAFTGVRISVGVAQGLGFALDRPLIPLSTLQVIATGVLQAHPDAPGALVAADARMGEVYTAAYRAAAPSLPEAVAADALTRPEAVTPSPGGWVGAGTGFAAHPDSLAARLRPGLAAIEAERLPDARDALPLAGVRYSAADWVPAEQAEPVYLRHRVTGPRR